MNRAGIFLCLVAIFFSPVLVGHTLSQTGAGASGAPMTREEKEFAKQARKKEAREQKESQKRKEQTRRSITVDFVQLTTFPNDYVGISTHRLYRIPIGEVVPYTEAGATYYLIRIGTSSAVPLPNQITFALADETLAKQVVATMQSILRNDVYARNRAMIGDVYFQLLQQDVNGNRFYLGKITCLAIVDSFSGLKRTPIGSCPLVE